MRACSCRSFQGLPGSLKIESGDGGDGGVVVVVFLFDDIAMNHELKEYAEERWDGIAPIHKPSRDLDGPSGLLC